MLEKIEPMEFIEDDEIIRLFHERKREQEPSYAPDASAIELSELHHVTREPAGRS